VHDVDDGDIPRGIIRNRTNKFMYRKTCFTVSMIKCKFADRFFLNYPRNELLWCVRRQERLLVIWQQCCNVLQDDVCRPGALQTTN